MRVRTPIAICLLGLVGCGVTGLGELVGGPDSGLVDSGVPCAFGLNFCDSGCVNLLADNQNCGACGNACDPLLSSCLNGSCNCLAETCPIADGGIGCFDTTGPTIPTECDLTGRRCAISCFNGATICYGPDGGPYDGGPSDAGDCGAYCADTTADDNNCGGCGIVCGHDQKCTQPTPGAEGQCVCDLREDGGSDLILCGNSCVHGGSDPLNCGACGHVCPNGEPCVRLDGGTEGQCCPNC